MRELKFRAWVNDHWVDWIPTCKTLGAYNASIIDTDGYTFEEDNPFIVEQYTGLKDKNGKEIYEGDIVRYSFTNPNRTYTEPVSFGPIQDGEGYYHQEFLAWRTTCVDDGEAHSSLLDLVEPNWTCEIIGNVHENPGLLGGKE